MENITEDIWLNFGNKLKSFIKSKVQNETIAEDILQETFIKIHSNIDKLEDNTKIQAWVYQITRNVIADHFRKTKMGWKHLPPPHLRNLTVKSVQGFYCLQNIGINRLLPNPAKLCKPYQTHPQNQGKS